MGAGNDLISVDNGGGNDTVNGGGGNDFIYYGATFTNADKNDGGAGTDTLGLNGNYVVTFDSDDLLNIERLSLGSGGTGPASSYDLTITDASVGAAGLTVVATNLKANETLIFTGTAETNGAFNVQSGAGADRISGGAQSDTLSGGGGDDFLLGRAGDDKLIGDAGADSLRGGFGKDTFIYKAVSDSTFSQSDTILDFEKGDLIDLSAIDANANSSDGDTAFTYIGDTGFSGQRGELRVFQAVQGTWFAVGDVDGDGVGDIYIQIKTPSGLMIDPSNFIL
jgi:Ca2+-binding RTX toxin-like protein